jgi:hypothetical protein
MYVRDGQALVISLVDWLFDAFALKGFWALCENIYEYVFCCNRCHGNAIKEF